MEQKIKEIIEILNNEKESEKKKIIMECASRIGSEEWQIEVKNFMNRMDKV